MVCGLLLSTIFLWLVGRQSVAAFATAIGLIGFFLYGPDSLITAAGAIDIGSPRYALLAAGLINGTGSLGPVLQEVIIGNLYQKEPTNLGPILGLLVGAASVATVMMAWLARRAQQGKANL